MPKLCIRCQKWPVFSHLHCKACQGYRTGKKAPKGLKKASKRIFDKERQIDDWNFYLDIWGERPHFCFNCEQFLGNEPLTLFFDHILMKSKFVELRYEKENIMLLCADCHQMKTNAKYSEKIKKKIFETALKFEKTMKIL